MRQGNILIPVVVALMAVTAFLLVLNLAITAPKKMVTNSNSADTNEVACIMDAKVCPDGSSVGRVPPKCKFAACPSTNTNPTTNTNLNTNSSTDATAGWKTYTNSTLGYSVKYPSTWQTSTCPDVSSVWFGITAVRCQTEGTGNKFSVDIMDGSFNLASTVADIKSYMTNPTETTITVNDVAGTRLTGMTKKDEGAMGGGGWFKDDVYVLHSGRYYHFGYFTTDGTQDLDVTFTNFLSTFTFTK